MTPDLQTALFLLLLLQVKHMFGDFFLQTPRMLMNRGVYLHVGRAQHASVHAVLSVIILALIGAPAAFLVLIGTAEWIVHFHIDWVKGRHAEQAQDGPEDAAFWRAFGVDQLMHQLTYVAMIWAWAVFAL